MRFIPTILFAFVAVLVALPLAAETRPNVIVVMTDDKYAFCLDWPENNAITPNISGVLVILKSL